MVRFAERIGTSASDSIVGITGSVTYGLAGNDFLTSQAGSAYSILIGGSGADTYYSRPNTTITIADRGSSANDVLYTQTLGPSSQAVTALIDNRHFVASDLNTGETVYIIDFFKPENYIEQIQTPDGTFTTDQLWQFARAQPSFLGNLRWEDLNSRGLTHPFSTAETNEAISFYEKRAAALEIKLPVGDEGSVYRFYNTEKGMHFYTSNVAERDSIAQNLFQYRYEGEAFDAATQSGANTTDVFRFFNRDTGAHFYTTNAAERDQVIRTLSNFNYEGVAYKAYTSSENGAHEELYRFFNKQTGAHFYTTSEAERDSIVANLPNYSFEGVAYYVDLA
ncbi:hypothetical protein [Aureimonas sp. AU20]|uniref:hypothetical protein n=1 Tax=Aureimonas sp. AU20 TaxID=1349819 RepID=UPI000721212F|nr:hypothetical protein [Aureimonas sp. AU20]ALN75649.1 hypothetical protein M673_23180 [Aureimonas sp. AU20]